jgi:Na+-translocating ferredoxin:NAD+ oxidoreductase RnfC subunit
LKEWKDGVERNNNVIAVFLDFKRAFKTIVRRKLIEKVKQYGIGGVAAKWFESYLDNRRQKTRINEAESTAIPK